MDLLLRSIGVGLALSVLLRRIYICIVSHLSFGEQ